MGKSVVVTRARSQASELGDLLRARGATAIEWPLIEIAPPLDVSAVEDAAARLPEFDWVVFSSANGVEQFLHHARGRAELPRIAAVGPKTAAALNAKGHRAHAMPEEFLGAALAISLGDVAGKRILVVRPEKAAHDLAGALRAGRAEVEEVIAYRTLAAREAMPFRWQDVHALTLASGSAARALGAHLHGQPVPVHVCLVSIGPSTSRTAEETGLRIQVEASIHTGEGLVAALAAHFKTRGHR
ncbi:MAG TPA: uroporphyrinogen-III synthase [Xanthobacteraceae bacterium]|nr:uroporphyrinogen-III synthase [Xanthobacteraceae bacterium]